MSVPGGAPEPQPGEEVAGYRVESVAGRGGMGVVWRATQLHLDRIVALKLIAGPLAVDPAFRERFVRESRVAASIAHPHVIPVLDAGSAPDGRLYIAMRYVEGDDLRTRVRRLGPMDPARAARVADQVGSALDAAHTRGIVHRDVKPANVLLGPGDHAYLTDFGLTKRLDAGAQVTLTRGWVGTLGYVAPEQIQGGDVDARTDVYALGCVLLYALTGAPPFERDSDEATLWAHLHAEPPLQGVPAALAPVLARALAKDPAARWPSAGALGRAAVAATGPVGDPGAPGAAASRTAASPPERLGTLGPSHPSRPLTPAAPTVSDPPPRRHRPAAAMLILAAVSVAAVVGLIALALVPRDPPAEPRPASGATRLKTASSTPSPAARRVQVVAAVPRANGIVALARRVFVISQSFARVTVLDTSTARARPEPGGPRTGAGAGAVSSGFGSLWVAKVNGRLLRYGQTGGSRIGPAVTLGPGLPVAAAPGAGALWVGSRAGGDRAASITRVDPATGATRVVPVPRGVQSLAYGAGAVWILDADRRGLTRLDPATLATSRISTGGQGSFAVAVGTGGVWVSNAFDATVTQIDPETRRPVRTVKVGRSPQGLDVAGGSVWVANRVDGTLSRIDARTGRLAGPDVAVGAEPFAVAARGREAWVTLLAEGTVARVRAPGP